MADSAPIVRAPGPLAAAVLTPPLLFGASVRQPLTGIQAASELLAQQPCVHNNEDASFLVAAISAASRMLAGAAWVHLRHRCF
jgi:hypothetical protein